jgi:transcriptional regulator with XRE-family HTH domain
MVKERSTSKEMNAMKRSYKRIATVEGKILRYMRLSQRLSMRSAGRLVNLSDSTVCHYEHGRLDLNPKTIERLVSAYGYSMDQFEEFRSGARSVPENLRDECITLLNRIQDPIKLRAVHSVLQGLTL